MKFETISIFIFLIGLSSALSLKALCNITKDNSIDCDIATGNYSTTLNSNKTQLKIVEYNVNDNGYGDETPYEGGIDKILDIITKEYSDADVIVMSEVARDCGTYNNHQDGPEYFAKSLKMNYAYIPEFVSYDSSTRNSWWSPDSLYKRFLGQTDDSQCTMGNMILSKYPFSSLEVIRFKSQCCMFPHRSGGRVTIGAGISIGGKDVQLYSTHLESGTGIKDFLEAYYIRVKQIDEIVDNYNAKNENYKESHQGKELPCLLMGDMNSPLDKLDPVIDSALLKGFSDAHSSIPFLDRNTTPFDTLAKFFLFIDDYILVKEMEISNSQICNEKVYEPCYGASDHYPISTNVSFK